MEGRERGTERERGKKRKIEIDRHRLEETGREMTFTREGVGRGVL